MGQPKFVFAAEPYPTPGQRNLAVREFRAAGVRQGLRVTWRLRSANNRGLAVSARAYPGFAACHDAVLALRARVGEVVTAQFLDVDTGQWGWRLDLDDQTVAHSARQYARARESAYSLDHALEAVVTASVARTDGPLLVSDPAPLDAALPEPLGSSHRGDLP
ncbi:hypothetical protein [Motilibacter aurantiacus]|uniref:hypothetical protein n=1 Tax=Motilibacter aurantiacus TaxID=2714955 RepID=UPI00140CE437|nr:hypothetical protein [Motilibacter aurantiacus]